MTSETEFDQRLVAELTAERDGLREQFHTQAEQRDFVGNLVDNMPHAQIAAELADFKSKVAAALRELRHEMIADLNNLTYHDEFRRGRGIAAGGLDAVIARLGLAPGKDEANG